MRRWDSSITVGLSTTPPAALLGLACHDALDQLVDSRSLFSDEWQDAAEQAWQRAISRVADDLALEGPAEELSGYQIKRVRLRQVAARIRELVGQPDEARVKLVPEETLESKDGLLYGRTGPRRAGRAASHHRLQERSHHRPGNGHR